MEDLNDHQLQGSLRFTWKSGPDMPFSMCAFIQSVAAGDTLYVGGGHSLSNEDNIYTVMRMKEGKWDTLPKYNYCYFAMAVVHEQLVVSGGWRYPEGYTAELGVWDADNNTWTSPYPDMPTGRARSSALVYKNWLVVAGGFIGGKVISSAVEVMNTDSKQWYTAPPTPTPWEAMRTALLGDTAYFMGGDKLDAFFQSCYSVPVSALIAHISSETSKQDTDTQTWKEIQGPPQLTKYVPFTIGESLLAVGGQDKDQKPVRDIYLYIRDKGTWAKIGDLPSSRYHCTCVLTKEREMLVAGGQDSSSYLQRVDLASID